MIHSKPKSREETQRDIERKTIQFFKTVEAGDIALFNIFGEAIAVFGFTKVGKTTSCHMMCGSTLKGESQRGQLIFKSTSNKFTTAKIGINPESETQIPNIFEALIKIKEPGALGVKVKKIPLLDQPGYGDTYGFHRIYSNGYFHYRTFSKTPKLKFILAFKKDDLIGTGEFFKKTIFNFINSFKNWEEVEESILKATSFLVTKADLNSKIQNLKEIVLSLRNTVANLSQKQIERYQKIIDAVIQSDRLFFIEKPKNAYDNRFDDKILQQVYDRSEFWERQINGNTVDMSNINFSVSKEILAKLRDQHEEVFRMEFEGFMKYSDKRVSEIFVKDKASLSKIIQTLKTDAVESSGSRQVLIDMEEFKQKYYKFRDDLDFNAKRETAIVNIFMEQNEGKWVTTTKEDIEKEMKSDYFIKKFSVIDYLQDLYQRLILEPEGLLTARTIESLQDFSSIFIGIFKKFSLLRETPNDKNIYKYSYIIQRIIEEFKILTLTMFSSEGVIQEITKMQIYTPKMDIFFIFKDEFMTRALDSIDSNKLKQEFINKIDFAHLNNINQETINFFQSIENKQEEVTCKIAKMVLEYSEIIFQNDRVPPEEEKLYIGGKLYKYRNNFYAHLLNLELENNLTQQVKEDIVEIIFSLTSRLAKILITMNMYEEARKCFKSINNSEPVFQIYDTEIMENKADKVKQRQLLLLYAEDAFYFHRKELALKCYQKVYALSSSYREMKQISQKIVTLSTDERDENEDYYLQRFQNQRFCLDYDEQLRSKIQFGLGYQDY